MPLEIQYRHNKIYRKENEGINKIVRTVEGGGNMKGIIDYCQILFVFWIVGSCY